MNENNNNSQRSYKRGGTGLISEQQDSKNSRISEAYMAVLRIL